VIARVYHYTKKKIRKTKEIEKHPLTERNMLSQNTQIILGISVIAIVYHYTQRKVRETMEIEKHRANINKNDGWRLSKTWCRIIKPHKTIATPLLLIVWMCCI